MNKKLKKDTLMAIKYLAEQHSDELYFDSYAGDWLDMIYSAGRTEAIAEVKKLKEQYEYHKDEIHCTCLNALVLELEGEKHVINIIKKKI